LSPDDQPLFRVSRTVPPPAFVEDRDLEALRALATLAAQPELQIPDKHIRGQPEPAPPRPCAALDGGRRS